MMCRLGEGPTAVPVPPGRKHADDYINHKTAVVPCVYSKCAYPICFRGPLSAVTNSENQTQKRRWSR